MQEKNDPHLKYVQQSNLTALKTISIGDLKKSYKIIPILKTYVEKVTSHGITQQYRFLQAF